MGQNAVSEHSAVFTVPAFRELCRVDLRLDWAAGRRFSPADGNAAVVDKYNYGYVRSDCVQYRPAARVLDAQKARFASGAYYHALNVVFDSLQQRVSGCHAGLRAVLRLVPGTGRTEIPVRLRFNRLKSGC